MRGERALVCLFFFVRSPARRSPLVPLSLSHSSSLPFEIIVIDDASPDGTQDVVRKLAAEYGEDRIVSENGGTEGGRERNREGERVVGCAWRGRDSERKKKKKNTHTRAPLSLSPLPPSRQQLLRPRPGKLGLGTAYAHGLASASGDFIIIMDADLSHHPKYIPAMVAAQQDTGADLVSGTRYAPGGGVAGWGARRKVTSRGANLLASLLLRPGLSDLTGSFRLFRRGLLARLVGEVRATGYAWQMEVAVRAAAGGAAIAEVPIVFVDRVYGASKLGGAEVALFLKGLARLVLTM